MTAAHLRTWFLWSMIGSLSLTALIGVAAVIFPSGGPEEEILCTTLVLGLYSLVALMCAAVLEKGRLVVLMCGGLGAVTVGAICWIVLIWNWRNVNDDLIVQLALTCTIVGIAIGHTGILSLRRFDHRGMEAVRIGTIATAATLAVQLVGLCWFFDAIGEELFFRAMAVLAILTAFGTVLTPVLWRVQAAMRSVSADGICSRIAVQLVCPRCGAAQRINAGVAGKCAACKLRITIEVEEPRCACGYLLYRLEAERCPECGRPVQDARRWPAAA